jgi:hypothetical protein
VKNVEDKIIIALACIIIGILIVWLLAGCGVQQVDNTKVVWHNGQCLLLVDGMTAQQAKQLTHEWELEDCKVSVRSDSQ